METNKILTGHALDLARQLPDNSISMIACSPPYFGLRDYSTTPIHWPEISFVPVAGLPEITIPEQEASLGAEKDPWAYIGHLVVIFRELRRVLHPSGVFWLNLGDSYVTNPGNGRGGSEKLDGGIPHYSSSNKKGCGLPEKNLMGIPWRTALALQADGYYLRSDIIWSKVNGMPESVRDRPTKSHEHIFLFSKSSHYYYDALAIAEPIKESSKARLGRGIGDSHKNINGAPGQTPHSMNQPRLNVKFGGSKADGYGTRIHSGNDWQPPEEGAMANRRSVWSIATQNYPGSHYAAWPEKLVELMVLAGSSEYGCCSDCGSPYRRIIDREPQYDKSKRQDRNQVDNPGQVDSSHWKPAKIEEQGWTKTCRCETDQVRPAIVLDPFMGSGTTARVAIAHRRHYLGFELNERYVQELAPDRLNGVQIRF